MLVEHNLLLPILLLPILLSGATLLGRRAGKGRCWIAQTTQSGLLDSVLGSVTSQLVTLLWA